MTVCVCVCLVDWERQSRHHTYIFNVIATHVLIQFQQQFSGGLCTWLQHIITSLHQQSSPLIIHIRIIQMGFCVFFLLLLSLLLFFGPLAQSRKL